MKRIRTDKLKACPFCGNKDSVFLMEPMPDGGSWVHCLDGDFGGCGAETKIGDSRSEAIANWNRRPNTEEQR